jgi:hypothetical protein
MKTSRLLAYAAAGMIVGLLIENKALVAKQYAAAKSRMLKKKADKLVHNRG